MALDITESREAQLALEESEAFSLDGIAYEAFNTSGGLGTLCDTLAGRVENLKELVGMAREFEARNLACAQLC